MNESLISFLLQEAEFISGKSGVEACASFFLDRGVRQACVLKDGARGSFLVQQKASMTTTKDSVHPSELRSEIPATMSSNRKNDLVVTHIPAYRIDKVVDTTGCGDNYCAGFECGLIKGWNLVECCR